MEKRRSILLDNLRMDYHWSLIRLYRNRARRLIDRGTPCTDRRLIRLSSRILQHGIVVSHIWRGGTHPAMPTASNHLGDKATA